MNPKGPGRQRGPAERFVRGAALIPCLLLLAAAAEGGEKRDLREVLDRVPRDERLDRWPNPAYERLVELGESGARWVDDDAFEAALRDLVGAISHLERLKSDPPYGDVYALRNFVRLHPILMHHRLVTVRSDPYCLFVEALPGERGGALLAGARLGAALQGIDGRFRKLFGVPLGLPPLAESDDPTLRTRKILVFRSEESFRKYQRVVSEPVSPGISAYYYLPDRWVVACVPPDDDGGARGSLLHVAAYQLFHALRRAGVQREIGETVLWLSKEARGGTHWFTLGTAYLLLPVEIGASGEVESIPRRHGLAEWLRTRKGKRSEWTLEELLRMRTGAELQARSQRKGLGDQRRLSSLFHVQAWSWAHFLYFHENGKYREKFLEYMDLEFRGRAGPERFARVWGDGKDYDWEPVRKEWLGYVEGLWSKLGLK